MPKSPKRKRPPKLSLFPLSLEEALKKALAVPFVVPKKQKKRKS
jgi:hypothetical protein